MIVACKWDGARWLVRYEGRPGWYVWTGPLCADCGEPTPSRGMRPDRLCPACHEGA